MSDLGAEMIGRHVLDGLAAEDARALERAAIQEHLREARVVAGRRDAATAAALELRRLRGIEQLDLLAGVRIGRQGLGQTRLTIGGDDEARIGHLERAKDALRENLAERLAGDDLDDTSEDVGRDTVLPRRARLVQGRQLGESLDVLLPRAP